MTRGYRKMMTFTSFNDPKKLEQALKDEFGVYAESIINDARYNNSMCAYM